MVVRNQKPSLWTPIVEILFNILLQANMLL
ncbi:unnamed protein product [Spirodela intermedia]|uniref:Uncharacterized protein n=1 Tax=Spirodela intermedia TaxID=51605 RepID=A0A7I8LA65_SPIIN|nr:unnamed protein product [Spirodela intermedia]